MRKINRRSFLQQGTIAAGAVALISQLPKQLVAQAKAFDMPLGFQTWSVKEDLAKNFTGTLKKMAAQGYQLLEMCSPKGYEDSGFGPLLKMKTADMRRIISDNGMSCPSCHF